MTPDRAGHGFQEVNPLKLDIVIIIMMVIVYSRARKLRLVPYARELHRDVREHVRSGR